MRSKPRRGGGRNSDEETVKRVSPIVGFTRTVSRFTRSHTSAPRGFRPFTRLASNNRFDKIVQCANVYNYISSVQLSVKL